MLTVISDLDDVWFDFSKVFCAMVETCFPGCYKIDPSLRHHWSLENALDLSSIQTAHILCELKHTWNLWAHLTPICRCFFTPDDTKLKRLSEVANRCALYFVTDRFQTAGDSVRTQTVRAINRELMIPQRNINIIVGSNKKEIAKALNAKVAIDDKPEHLKDYLSLNMAVFAPPRVFTQIRGVDQSGIDGFLDTCLDLV